MFADFSSDRDRVIDALQGSLPLIEEAEIQDTVNSLITKINALLLKDINKNYSNAASVLPVRCDPIGDNEFFLTFFRFLFTILAGDDSRKVVRCRQCE
jgi:hypothetical protein